MEKLNFIVVFTGKDNDINKYGIVYFYEGIKYTIAGEKYSFNNYNDGVKYVNENYAELAEIAQKNINELKAQIEKAKAEAEAAVLAAKREEVVPKNGKKVKGTKANRFKAGFLAGLLAMGLFGTALFAGSRLEKSGFFKKAFNVNSSSIDTSKDTTYDKENNVVTITDGEIEAKDGEYSKEDEKLTDKKFEELCNSAAKYLSDKGINVNTSDIVKYVAIFNIDKMSTDCPEVLKELLGNQKEEEFLSDAAKVIGAAAMYNYNVYAKDGNTDGFVKAQEFVFGSQKEQVKTIDEYVEKISKANKAGDAALTEKTARELIDSINDPTSKLSYLDDGVGFGIQADIEVIISTVSGDNILITTDPITGYQYPHGDKLSDETASLLHQFSTAERYVSNILTELRGCKTAEKTDTKTNDEQTKSAPVTRKLTR